MKWLVLACHMASVYAGSGRLKTFNTLLHGRPDRYQHGDGYSGRNQNSQRLAVALAADDAQALGWTPNGHAKLTYYLTSLDGEGRLIEHVRIAKRRVSHCHDVPVHSSLTTPLSLLLHASVLLLSLSGSSLGLLSLARFLSLAHCLALALSRALSLSLSLFLNQHAGASLRLALSFYTQVKPSATRQVDHALVAKLAHQKYRSTYEQRGDVFQGGVLNRRVQLLAAALNESASQGTQASPQTRRSSLAGMRRSTVGHGRDIQATETVVNTYGYVEAIEAMEGQRYEEVIASHPEFGQYMTSALQERIRSEL